VSTVSYYLFPILYWQLCHSDFSCSAVTIVSVQLYCHSTHRTYFFKLLLKGQSHEHLVFFLWLHWLVIKFVVGQGRFRLVFNFIGTIP
jgi:hypothetical protein